MVIAGTSDRFNQPGYTTYDNLESLLVNAANSEPFNDQFNEVVALYGDDFDISTVAEFWYIFSENAEKIRVST